MKMLRGVAALAQLVALTGVMPVSAQTVRGQLVDQANGFPIGGAFVVLLDTAGHEVDRALTGSGGAFVLKAPSGGRYRLQSKRIGFRVSESPPLALADSQTVAYRLEVQAVPARLPPVIVEGRPQCGTRGEEGTVVAQLWDEAREALAAVKWTEGQRLLEFTVRLFEREFGPVGDRVEKERTWGRRGTTDTPFRSIPGEQLVDSGYVVGDDRTGRTYYAPDATVLLGDGFSNTHCFVPLPGLGTTQGMVGLAFTPAPTRRLPDVKGALWVDRETAELRFLEYHYANLPGTLPEGALGGRVEFMRIETGAWIVRRWSIRMPVMGLVVNQSRHGETESRVLGFRETGGQVTDIRSPAGKVVYSSESTILEGTVVDSTRGGLPLENARVALAGTPYVARTDAAGRFQLTAPLEGSYDATFTHPRLDSLGAGIQGASVTLALGGRTTAVLAVPPEQRLLQRLCPSGLREGERAIAGTVRTPDGSSPVDSAEVRVSWQEVSGGPGSLQAQDWHLSAVTDAGGRYLMCGVPSLRVTLVASLRGARSGEVVLRFTRDGVWVNETQYRSLPGRIWTQDLQLGR